MSSRSYKTFDVSKIKATWVGDRYVVENTSVDLPPLKIIQTQQLKGEGDGGVLQSAKGVPVKYPAKVRPAAKFKCGLVPGAPTHLDAAAARALVVEQAEAYRVLHAIDTEIMRQIYEGRLGPIGAKANERYDALLASEYGFEKRVRPSLSFAAFVQEFKDDATKGAAFKKLAYDDFMAKVPHRMPDPKLYNVADGKPLTGVAKDSLAGNSSLALWPEWYVFNKPFGAPKKLEYAIPTYADTPAGVNFADVYEAATREGLVYTLLKYTKTVDGVKQEIPRPLRDFVTKDKRLVTLPDPFFCGIDGVSALVNARIRVTPYHSTNHQNAWGINYVWDGLEIETSYMEEEDEGEPMNSGFDFSLLKRTGATEPVAAAAPPSSSSLKRARDDESPAKRARDDESPAKRAATDPVVPGTAAAPDSVTAS